MDPLNNNDFIVCKNKASARTCRKYAIQGYCESNQFDGWQTRRKLMSSRCPVECNFCEATNPKPCSDEDICDKSDYYCNWSFSYAAKCRRTCGFCEQPCSDKRTLKQCQQWKGEGKCSSSKTFMERWCRDTCQFCEGGTTSTSTTSTTTNSKYHFFKFVF